MTEKIQQLYRGRVIQLNLETVILPNDREIELEIVRHPGGVVILAQDPRGRLCLIRQYRHAAGGWIWEFPAGKLESGEPPELTARRELLEEAGVEAESWHRLGKTVTSPGILTEVVHIYFARELNYRATAHEEGELIEIHWMGLDEIEDMVIQGELIDAKSLVGLYLLNNYVANS
ncbi:MAG: NUDIX hydrolase [Gammaproteobacteria bacterium]